MLPTPGEPLTDCVNAPAPFCWMTYARYPWYDCTPTTLLVTTIDPDDVPSGSLAFQLVPDASVRVGNPLARPLMYERACSRSSPTDARAPTAWISPSGPSSARHD